jgi:hypothetical protein
MQSSLKTHARVHICDKPYPCIICNKAFVRHIKTQVWKGSLDIVEWRKLSKYLGIAEFLDFVLETGSDYALR